MTPRGILDGKEMTLQIVAPIFALLLIYIYIKDLYFLKYSRHRRTIVRRDNKSSYYSKFGARAFEVPMIRRMYKRRHVGSIRVPFRSQITRLAAVSKLNYERARRPFLCHPRGNGAAACGTHRAVH